MTAYSEWRRRRRLRRHARVEVDRRIELLADALAEDVAGPWVTPADVAEAARNIRIVTDEEINQR